MRKQNKVIMVAPLPPPYGGITQWYKLVKEHADKEGVEIINIDSSPKKQNRSLFHRIFVQGFQMISLNSRLKEVIKRDKNVVTHICTSGSLGTIRDILMLKTCKKRNIKSIYHLHFGRIPEIYKGINWEYRLINRAIRFANSIITMDKLTYIALKENYPQKSIYYIPNPVVVPNLKENIKTEKIILYAGWIVKTKGIEELLEAWKNVKNSYPDYSLHLLGQYTDEYYQYLKDNFDFGRVIFHGYVEHSRVLHMLNKCTLFVLPSYSEGCPNVILEALAYGKPIIATSVGDIPSLLSDDCGLVIPPKSIKELEYAFQNLLDDLMLCKRLGDKAREKVETSYRIEEVFRKYEKVWVNINEADNEIGL